MSAIVEEICPDKKKQLEDIRLPARTSVSRTEELGTNLIFNLKENVSKFDYFLIATDKSAEICDSSVIIIYSRN